RTISPILYPSTWLFSAAPRVSASASHSTIDAGQAVTLTGVVSGGASPTAVHWNFGDGSSSTTLSGSHTYTQTGLITATVTVTDLVGHNVSASTSVFVNPALAVTANATPTSPFNATWVAFGSQTTGGTAPFTYSWALGDGTASASSALGHVYATKGTYSVKLTVTDAVGGTASASFSVVVQGQVVPPPPAHTSTSSNSVSLTSGTGLYLVIGIVLLLVIVVALAAMLAMRPRSPPGGTPPPYAAAPPPPGSVPPPGAGGPPSP
ncbi:MAG: PKD domain-containing protein, partial [Thermoplasmata archaeon]|nr:PKD domain-containing protein [Thermoplasmata archaeon]